MVDESNRFAPGQKFSCKAQFTAPGERHGLDKSNPYNESSPNNKPMHDQQRRQFAEHLICMRVLLCLHWVATDRTECKDGNIGTEGPEFCQ